MVGEDTREAEVVGSNPNNAGKNHAACDAGAVGKRKYLIFIHAAHIYFSTQKNDARYLCIDIGDGLRIS